MTFNRIVSKVLTILLNTKETVLIYTQTYNLMIIKYNRFNELDRRFVYIKFIYS